MVSRQVYPPGAKHLVPLFDLCIPGLDVNDPMKTMSTCMFIIQAVATVKIADLTRPEAQEITRRGSVISYHETGQGGLDDRDDPDVAIVVESSNGEIPKLSLAQENQLIRESTVGFPDWVEKFFKAVLALFDNLPEPGKSGRTGGKLEESMTSSLNVSRMSLFCAFSLLKGYITRSSPPASSFVNSSPTTCLTQRSTSSSPTSAIPLAPTPARQLDIWQHVSREPTRRRPWPNSCLSASKISGSN
jgi:Proteasome-substrate-size regulator, mid region